MPRRHPSFPRKVNGNGGFAANLALAELVVKQHDVVTASQLRQLGIADGAIAYRVRTARLHKIHRGVYAVTRRSLSLDGRFLAAVLSVGEAAALSHISAAILWGFWPEPRDVDSDLVDVTATRKLRPRTDIRLHPERMLPAREVTRHRDIPVTMPARTLLDLASVVRSERELRRAVHQAEVERRVSHPKLEAQLARSQRHRGAAHLAAVIAPGPAPTRSELEDRALELLREIGFAAPLTNARIAELPGRPEVDFLFPDLRLVIETDGARYHDTPLARAADARKQAILEAAGYRVIRLTWNQVTRERAQTVARLRTVLELQSALIQAQSALIQAQPALIQAQAG